MRTPEQTARLAAETMLANDPASRGLGMEVQHIAPGAATLAMTVTPAMTNSHGIAHGGFIFTLADSTFAFASASYGHPTVAAHCSIAYLRPGRLGDRLVATAREVWRSGRSGLYDVQVSVNGTPIAEFRGHSRQIGGNFIDAAAEGG